MEKFRVFKETGSEHGSPFFDADVEFFVRRHEVFINIYYLDYKIVTVLTWVFFGRSFFDVGMRLDVGGWVDKNKIYQSKEKKGIVIKKVGRSKDSKTNNCRYKVLYNDIII